MLLTAKLDPNSFIAKQWVELFPQGGTICGAKFNREGRSFVCNNVPPESIQALQSHPNVKIIVRGTSTAVQHVDPPPPEPKDDLAGVADLAEVDAELESLFSGPLFPEETDLDQGGYFTDSDAPAGGIKRRGRPKKNS